MVRFTRRRRPEAKQDPPEDLVEPLTGKRPVVQEVAELGDHDTVRRWLRELHTASDQQVWVHRPSGVVCAVANGGSPAAVMMGDGEKIWHSKPPTTMDVVDLTPEQVEHVILDALTSPDPPRWPVWYEL